MSISKKLSNLLPKDKDGNINFGIAFAIGFVVLAIITAVAGQVIQGVRDSTAANTAARNASDNALTGINNFAGQFGVLGTVGIAAVLIAIVATAFFVAARQ